MDMSLRSEINQFIGVVAATLVPVILTAFLSMPYTLGGHPGEERAHDALSVHHMT